jgi:hypothetical protein
MRNEIMKMLEKLSSTLKHYPYRERLPFAAMMLCLLAWEVHTSRPLTDSGRVIIAALSLVFFFGWKTKSYWFLWGIAVGAMLAKSLHSLLVHLGW